MKNWILLLLLTNTGCISASTSTTRFTLHVTDCETGCPITNAVAQTYFILKHDPWGGESKYNHKKIPVGIDGILEVTEETIRDTGGGATIFSEGYYTDGAGFSFLGHNAILNRWEPWNPTIEVKLRPKKNPVQMVYKRVENKPIPSFEQPVGFDLEKMDWVAPHGKGLIGDFIFSAQLVEQPKSGIKYSLSFSNPLDGIQEYVAPENTQSEYIFPYTAPTNGYVSTFNRYRLLKYPVLPDYPANNLKDDKDINYIFRVRTQVDKDGNIVSANHGRIRGEIRSTMKGGLYFSYWFNPNPHSYSLESDNEPY